MEEQHERLFDLITSKSFEELSSEEKSFVGDYLTEAEYTLQRTVIAASSELEYDSEEPLPLSVTRSKKNFLNRTIPLYQALIGAACIVLLFLVVNTKRYTLNWHISEHPLEISLTNGVSSGKIIHDTIVKEIPVFQTVSRIVYDTVTIVQTILQQPEKRMLEAGNTLIYPELNEKLLETKSIPYKDDQTSRFLPQIDITSNMK